MSDEEMKAIELIKDKTLRNTACVWLDIPTIDSLRILVKLIEKQQKEIDKLKSENQIFQRIKNGTTIIFKAKKKYIVEDKINKYYISKNKISEKIKELEKEAFKSISISEKINVLKELLEE